MPGPNVEDLVYVMRTEEGQDEQYVRLVVLHAGRLVNAERSGMKIPEEYLNGYRAAIIDYANGVYNRAGAAHDAEPTVREDIKRMKKAISADRDKADAEREL